MEILTYFYHQAGTNVAALKLSVIKTYGIPQKACMALGAGCWRRTMSHSDMTFLVLLSSLRLEMQLVSKDTTSSCSGCFHLLCM